MSAEYGLLPPLDDDGNERKVKGRFGYFWLHPDGKTIENFFTGEKYDLSQIGGGSYTDEDAQDAIGTILGNYFNYDDAGNSITLDESSLIPSASDDGALVVEDVTDFDFGTNATVTDDGDGTVTIDVTGGSDTRVETQENDTSVYADTTTLNFDTTTALALTDDGSGKVTLTAVDTDTHAEVRDDGTTVLTDVDYIDFGTDVSVTDNGDGGVTVDVSGATDTRIDVSDNGTVVVSEPADVNFGTNLSVTDDGDGTVTVSAIDTDTRVETQDAGTSLYTDTSVINFDSTTAITVTDNGSGQITISAVDTDTHADIQDGGTSVLTDVSYIDFGTNTTVTDNGDGGVTVDVSGGTDTRTDISHDGTVVVSDTQDINFTTALDASSDGDGTVTVAVEAGGITTTELANDAVTSAKIAADAVGSSQIATGAVGSTEILDGAVNTAEIATNAVTPDGLDPAGSYAMDGLSIRQGHGPLGLPNHHVNYGPTLSNQEIARFQLAAGDSLEVWSLQCQLKGGGTNSNVSLDVYDATNGTVLASVTGGSRKSGGTSPLGTSGSGVVVLVRLTTGGTSVDICNNGMISVI